MRTNKGGCGSPAQGRKLVGGKQRDVEVIRDVPSWHSAWVDMFINIRSIKPPSQLS